LIITAVLVLLFSRFYGILGFILLCNFYGILGFALLLGFPTASHIVDYTKYNGQTGRMLNVLGIVKGKSSFLFSYSNSKQAFYISLPIVSEILKSIVIWR
jgi:hypothetical protein